MTPSRDNRPLDDQPDGAIVRRRRAVSGDVVKYRAKPARNERDEFPSEDDIERFSDVTTTCPACGAKLFDDVDVCYQCGEALSGVGRKPSRWAGTVTTLVVIVLIVALLMWSL